LLFDPPQEELWAVGRTISEQGWGPLDPEVCMEICGYIIGECKSSEYRFDLRLLTSAFTDYIHCLEKDAGCHWQDLVDSTIAKTVLPHKRFS
jgi:transcription initiation factor IIF auxiliary subunit